MSETLSERQTVDSQGRPVICPHMHHFGIATTRNDEMSRWYRDVLGMEVVLDSVAPLPKMAFVTNDLAHHRGGFFSPPNVVDDPEKANHARYQHLAWEYDSVDDLLDTWARIKDLGIEPAVTCCHGPSFAFYYRDPDDNPVELLADAYGDMRKSLEHMSRPEMITNPMGGYVDPAKLIEARQAGVSLDELRKRSLAGEYKPAQEQNPLATW